MDKVKRIQEKARVLRGLLIHYAKQDNDVQFVLDRMTPLLDAIEAGKAVPPRHDDFGRYFLMWKSRSHGSSNILSFLAPRPNMHKRFKTGNSRRHQAEQARHP